MNSNDLVKRDGLYYKKSSDIPFTGDVSGGEQDELEWTPAIAGEWTHSYSNGELLHKGKGKFANGEKEGEWVFLDEDGRFSSRGEFENGLKEGEWLENHIGYRVWSKGSYKNGKSDGDFVRYFSDGRLWAKGRMKNGIHDGELLWYHHDGTIDEKNTGIWKNQKKVGDSEQVMNR